MHTLPITKIVIHSSATQNGKQLRSTTLTAAQRIDDWHKQRGFQRLAGHYKTFNPHLQHIGYHFITSILTHYLNRSQRRVNGAYKRI